MPRIAFSVPGEPKAKGRPRALARLDSNGDPFVQMVTPDDTRLAEAAVRAAFRAKYPEFMRPWTGPVMLRFTAVFETPKSFNRALKDAAARGKLYATKKPDKDNIEKLIVDALNHIVFSDDQQVMGGGIKRYGSPARIDVELELIDQTDMPVTPGQKRAERKLDQPTLPLVQTRAGANAAKLKSKTPDPAPSPKVAPDLSSWSPRQRQLIEAAMARDEAARKAMKR